MTTDQMDWALEDLEGFAARNGYEVVLGVYLASPRTSPAPGRDAGGWPRCVLRRDGQDYRYWHDGRRWKRA